jgi:hypothetical protein
MQPFVVIGKCALFFYVLQFPIILTLSIFTFFVKLSYVWSTFLVFLGGTNVITLILSISMVINSHHFVFYVYTLCSI